ncbi:arsinothricin biosynthesis radical SAM protein ArsL [Actibacterium sp. 188UL27-1]|uniref:arsinothricin biosynthesis radical SAM protein ArsL n=1 Tax=Actibacterium sp. 188UL27-1 TaxID=2786961 RepID=UPI0019596EF4|nr:arsinothricin biosynthesis radical SAM protein ArsL [Actibacterium sp. 188UL27-1]MBM7068587.1 radical SAM protein [Actibacterium sp. 188UL27-1]
MSSSILVSIFEGGYQPINALTGLAALRNAGHDTDFLDAYVEGYDIDRLKDYDTIILPVPLFDSLNSAIRLCKELDDAGCTADKVMFGQYATINAKYLTGRYADHVVSGEWEVPLVSLMDRKAGSDKPVINVYSNGRKTPEQTMQMLKLRGTMAKPMRQSAPNLSKYPQPHLTTLMGEEKIVGGLELTRGCHHKCTYCSVFSAYDGKVLLGDIAQIQDDVDALVDQGMEHMTFIDAEFFNATRRSFDALAQIHKRHPALTFDFTTRVDHILENNDRLGELYDHGVRVITSALEFPKNEVLQQVRKEVDVDDLKEAVRLVQNSGITLNPTFIMFNPWVTLEDFPRFHDFLVETGMEDAVDPVQFETRLHLYKGSPLLKNETIKALRLEEQEFHYDWFHSDERVDELFRASVTPAVEGEFKRCCLKC